MTRIDNAGEIPKGRVIPPQYYRLGGEKVGFSPRASILLIMATFAFLLLVVISCVWLCLCFFLSFDHSIFAFLLLMVVGCPSPPCLSHQCADDTDVKRINCNLLHCCEKVNWLIYQMNIKLGKRLALPWVALTILRYGHWNSMEGWIITDHHGS